MIAMTALDSFDEMIDRLRAHDEDAAREVFRRFANRLIGLSHSRLDKHLRQKVDAEDVIQSVFRSFFIRQAKGQFELENWDGLWSLLVRITLRKCGQKARVFHAECRDVGQEIPLAGSDDESRDSGKAIARNPTPQEAASLVETVEHVLSGLDERRRQMVVLRLQGYTVLEISQEVGCTERTVHRVLGKVRDSLRRLEVGAAS